MNDNGMVTIEQVWRTNAGAELFNGLSRMQLVRQDGNHVFFSHRRRIVERFIGMLLEGGLVPSDMTQRVVGRWEEVVG